MIVFDRVSVTYPGETTAVLCDVNFAIDESELCLVVGRTGTGKSTLLRTINGLVPHFTGGLLRGRVTIDGRDTSTHPPRELADLVGMVAQNPTDGFVTDVVEDELAYGMESLGFDGATMRRRVEETLDIVGLADLRRRPLATLSAGQRQRVALGAVLTTQPKVVVLDEPTSALDPPAAEDVLAVLQRLVHDVGVTVVLAEHRLERVIHFADRIVQVNGPGLPVEYGLPNEIMQHCPVAPPVVELGRHFGWQPLPLSIRQARRLAADENPAVPASVTGSEPELPRPIVAALPTHDAEDPPSGRNRDNGVTQPSTATSGADDQACPNTPATPVVSIRSLTVAHGALTAVDRATLHLAAGTVTALMGRNGAGKTTLLQAVASLLHPSSGSVEVAGRQPALLSARELARTVGFVPNDPHDVLYAETVAQECQAADRDTDAPAGSCARLLDELAPQIDPLQHPRDLSEGQRLALALAIMLTAQPPLLLLDEPTRGLDYPTKKVLIGQLRQLAAKGHVVVVATHDVEFAAFTDRVVMMADGELVVDGPTRDVITSSPAFAPQIARVMAPAPFLTIDEVARSYELPDTLHPRGRP